MAVEDDIAAVEAQPLIDAESFGNDDAVDLGLIAVSLIRERDLNLCVRIVLGGDEVFLAKLKSTGPGNDPWLAGKAEAVALTGEPSLLARLRAEAEGIAFTDRPGIDHDTVKGHGGSLPIRVQGAVVGTITMSGEPDTVDHATVSEAVRRYLAR